MTSLLVTGAAGYIGSHVVNCFRKNDPKDTIVALDDLTQGHREAVPDAPNVHFFQGSIDDTVLLEYIFHKYKIDIVIHLAANTMVAESQSNPFKYFENNVARSLHLFDVMEKHSIRKIVFSSTCAIYGDTVRDALKETYKTRPVSMYGTTKLMVETALQSLAANSGWTHVVFRFFNASGADVESNIGESHNPETHLIPLALRTAYGAREFLSIFGTDYHTKDGTCIRDFVHVNDIADGHVLAVSHLLNSHESLSVNLGSHEGSSVLDVVKACEKITGRKINLRYEPRRHGDPHQLIADFTSATKTLGWKPSYSLEEIIETAWKWEQSRRF